MEIIDLPGMFEAIRTGDVIKVARLLDENPDFVFIESPFGGWLDLAASEGQLDIVKYLVDRGLDVNRINHYGSFPICEAAESGNPEIFRYLLSRGAVIRTDLDDECANPMFSAIQAGSLEVVQILLDHGLDPLREYANGKNVINFALLFGYKPSAELMITHVAKGDIAKAAGLYADAQAIADRQGKPKRTRILQTFSKRGKR